MSDKLVDTDVVSYIYKKDPRAAKDSWIAATALLYGVELVMRNASDFAYLPGLTIITEP
jgi:predicted nucleic acid-binding protein